ncbi:MAG: hypothetical protein LAN18_01065 [Acidobacteriia bacterium]|nr:hypothetical protein [Terriglobia bacterium]
MANKFVSFLQSLGRDFKAGLSKLDPFVKKAISVAQAAEPEITALDPAIGTIFTTVVTVVSSIEQKFAAMGQQTGTGVQKLAEATSILAPVVTQAFTAAGKAADLPTVQNYISAVVNFLNAIPATPAPSSTPATS